MNPKELPKQIQEDDELRIKLEKEEAIFSLKQYIKEKISELKKLTEDRKHSV